MIVRVRIDAKNKNSFRAVRFTTLLLRTFLCISKWSDKTMISKDGAWKFTSIFARFKTKQEKQILARATEIPKENWG